MNDSRPGVADEVSSDVNIFEVSNALAIATCNLAGTSTASFDVLLTGIKAMRELEEVTTA